MFFQLPTGKTIYLTIDEYLNLTDNDILYLVATNSGDTIVNPFAGSAVNKNAKEKHSLEDYSYLEDEVEISIDITIINIDDFDPDDFPSYEGDDEI